ncbi:MAG: glycosyl transferase [Pseudomonadota bacterium]
MSDVKQVICIKWGAKYGADYVNRLYRMVARNITPPFTFTAFTDDPDGLSPDIQVRDLPPLPAEMPVGTPGKWPKSRLWGAELGGLSGPVLFIDLDVVILGSLDEFFSHGEPDDVILARNMAKPFHRLGQTSIYRFPVGKLAPMQTIFAADPQAIGTRYRYEQHFVTENAPGGVSFWPRSWVKHFRIQCVPPFPLNLFRDPPRPKSAKVVIFAGDLNPPDAVAGRWNAEDVHRPPLEHLTHALRSGGGFKAVRSYVRPTKWVADEWSDMS